MRDRFASDVHARDVPTVKRGPLPEPELTPHCMHHKTIDSRTETSPVSELL